MTVNYQCTRCGYETPKKSSMEYHLIKRQKQCPTSQNDITLTPDIIDHILKFRIYHIKKNYIKKQIINNNQYNTIFANLDILDKMKLHLKTINKQPVTLDDKISDMYQSERENMETGINNIPPFTKDYFINTIIESTTVKDKEYFQDCNILLQDQQCILYKETDDGEDWSKLTLNSLVKEVLKIIQRQYSKSYEFYLIRKIESNNEYSPLEKRKFEESLDEYYSFIGSFDIKPSIINMNNNQILYNIDQDEYYFHNINYDICDKYITKYNRLLNELKTCSRNRIQKEIANIIHSTIKTNTKLFEKNILNFFIKDQDYIKNINR
jgi:hypothetical protein